MADLKLSDKATVSAFSDRALDTLAVVIDGTPDLVRRITPNDALQTGYAEIYGQDISATQVLPTVTPAKHTAFGTNGAEYVAVADQANDQCIATDAGRYRVRYSAVVSVDVATLVTAIAYVEGSAVNLKDEQDIGTSRGRLCLDGFVDALAGDTVDVRLLGAAGSTITTRQVRLSIERVVT